MRRFFQSAGPGSDGSIVLDGAEAHHAVQVIRLRVGERAVVLDGRGGEYVCLVSSVARREVRLQIERTIQHQAPACRVRLVQAVTKGKSFEVILQKAVELGAAEILPLLTERVVARPAGSEFLDKQAKWQQVAVEAIKQCGATWLPRVLVPASVADAQRQDDSTEMVIVAALSAETAHLRTVFESFIAQRRRMPKTISAWIGPEGDFTPEELKLLLQAGAKPVSLGPNVLRSETAALCALSALGQEITFPR
jgi:16S rRNA (uracil1498-N3)-methyltransferase